MLINELLTAKSIAFTTTHLLRGRKLRLHKHLPTAVVHRFEIRPAKLCLLPCHESSHLLLSDRLWY
jgi:hypothetical protein